MINFKIALLINILYLTYLLIFTFRIINGINEIFFRQISCWLLYGDLIDSHQEFFIHESSLKTNDSTPFEKYSLNCSMLPNHIDVPLAGKILRVGQTVLFLRSNPEYLNNKGRF